MAHEHCGSEAHEHDHHDHDHDDPDRGAEYSLYQKIELDKVRCLNELVEGSAKLLFKPWNERLDDSKIVESDADEQLILHIPFTGQIKLKTIALRCVPDESCPLEMRAFVNQEGIDFDTVEATKPVQTWELIRPDDLNSLRDGIAEYATRITRFGAVRSLTLYFPRNNGSDSTKLLYVGLRGEFTEITKDPVITIYEAAPNPSDHVPIAGINGTAASNNNGGF